MKLKPQRRFFNVQADRLNADARTVAFSFSSESPVERYFGAEVLSHKAGAADLSRLNDGAPLLFNHDLNDVIGVVEQASIGQDMRGHCTVRFAKTARADEVLGMVADGVLRNVSFMYRINDAIENAKTGEFLVTKWQPMEISIVTVPADQSVGIGRSGELAETEVNVRQAEVVTPAPEQATESTPEATAASVQHRSALPAVPAIPKGNSMENENNGAPAAPGADGATAERLRITAITQMARQHKMPEEQVRDWINGGTSVDEVAQKVLDVIAARGTSNPSNSAGSVGLNPAEVKNYSLFRAMSAALNKNWSKAGLEYEAHKAVAARTGMVSNENTFFVPLEVQKRDLTVGTSAAGGYLVETQNQGFIELLRNRSVVMGAGARRLTGLQGNVAVPKQSASGTAYWLTDEAGTGLSESNQTFGQMILTPKTVASYTEISRQLLLQSSPDAEGLVMADLAAITALAVDKAALEGTGGSGQPTGLASTAGLGSVTGTSLGIAGIVEFQTDVAGANALGGAFAYVTTPAVAGLLMQRQRFTSTDTPLWQGGLLDGMVMGFKGMASNQLAAATMIAGDWSQLIVAEWGVLQVEVNPYANFQAGIVGVRAMYSVDIGVRYPGAFSRAVSIT
jgi:HK97 family phage major capsid protein/HK97 family phage prohead protease